nr:reverse transcriptase domain-containing protein [Tanacetum cinerariifolium]
MIQQIKNSCQFHGLPGDDVKKHLDKFLHVTQIIKVNGVTNDALRLYLFPHSLTHHATAWFDRLLRNSINTFEQMAKMFLRKYFPPSMVTKLRNEITNFCQCPDESLFKAWERYKLSIDRSQRSESSSSITSSSDTKITKLKVEMAEINKNLMSVLQPPLAKHRTYMMREPIKVILTNLKGASHGQNPPPTYQAPAYQAPGYQALVHQPSIPQPQVVTTNEFTNYMKANDAILKNMQTNMTSLTNLNLELKNMFGQFMKMNTASSLGSGTLPSNSITNPKEDLKERKTEATKDTMRPTNNGSIKDVQPPVVQAESPTQNSKPIIAPIIEPIVAPVSAPKPNMKPSILYPSRLHDQKVRDKANDQKEIFFQIFKDLDFKISFTDALILMPKFGPTIKNLLTNKDKLSELARTPLNEHCSAVLLKKLPEKLRDPGKSFLKTERALIDVFEGELTLRVGKEAIKFNLDQTSRYSANYNDMTANRIDVIDMACEEYSQEVLGFFDVTASGNPTPYYDPIVSTSSPTLTPFEDNDFLLEEVDAFLALEDDPTSPEVDQSYFDSEGDIILLEAFLTKSNKSSIDEPPEVKLKDLPPHLKYAFLEGDDKLPVIIAKDLSDEEKTALITILMEENFKPTVQHQRRVNPKIHDVIKKEVKKLLNAGLIYPISDSRWVSPVHCVPKKGGFIVVENEENELIPTRLVTGWRVCIDYRKLNKATRKDHFPLPFMDQMLERLAGNEYYCFLDGFSEKMLKRCEDTNLCLNWEKSHFMVKEGIVLGHKISKDGIEVDKAKVEVITKLPHPTTVKVICSFLGHVGLYRRFIKDFSKIARPMTRLLEKDTLFLFSKECVEAFKHSKENLLKLQS